MLKITIKRKDRLNHEDYGALLAINEYFISDEAPELSADNKSEMVWLECIITVCRDTLYVASSLNIIKPSNEQQLQLLNSLVKSATQMKKRSYHSRRRS